MRKGFSFYVTAQIDYILTEVQSGTRQANIKQKTGNHTPNRM